MDTVTENCKIAKNHKIEFICQQALPLFKKHGYQRTSVRMIAAACDMTVPGLYYHIRAKEDILTHLVTQDVAAIEEVLGTTRCVPNPRATLANAMYNWYRICDQRSNWIIVGYRETLQLPKGAREKLLAADTLSRCAFETLATKAIEARQLDAVDVTILAEYIVLSGHMWALRGWHLRKQYTLEQYIQRQLDFVLRKRQ